MAVTLQNESTEYVYVGVTGAEPTSGAEIAFMQAGDRPESGDWDNAIVVNAEHALWADATSSGITGDYYVAILVGGYMGNTVAPAVGDWQVWLRLTDDDEQPVRIVPVALEIA